MVKFKVENLKKIDKKFIVYVYTRRENVFIN